MTNALDLIPTFRRQIGVYTQGTNTSDSALAGYIADGVQALGGQWERSYAVEFTSPMTYHISPDVEPDDIRPIILMSSIIYKMGNYAFVNWSDGDFSWAPHRTFNPVEMDRQELLAYVPTKLAQPTVGQFLGFKSIYNPESYSWLEAYNWVWGYNVI